MEVGSTPGTGSATLVDHRRGFLDGPLIQLYFGGGRMDLSCGLRSQ